MTKTALLGRALLALPAALLLLIGAAPGGVQAHATLERAVPPVGVPLPSGNPPQVLRLFFTEELDPGFSRIQVTDAQRERVDRGDSRVSPENPREMGISLQDSLPDGIYTVAYRSLSLVDGHTVNGSYPLIVGEAPAAAARPASSEALFAPETALARWWFFIAASGLFGSLLTWLIVFAPLHRGGASPSPVRGEGPGAGEHSGPVAGPRIQRAIARLALVSSVALLAAVVYSAVAQAAEAADVPLWGGVGPPLVELLSRGRYALLWWSRLGLVVLAAGLLFWRPGAAWSNRLTLGAAGGALLTVSLNSHSAALASGPYLGVAADWVHLLAVATWIGGLAALAAAIPAILQSGQGGVTLLTAAAGRFSLLGMASVVVIAATGAFSAWLHAGSLEGVRETAYGWALTAKTAGLVSMLGLAGYNLFVARRRLAALATRGAEALGAVSRFSLAVRGELALGALVLAAAAVLTGLAPAREDLARRASADARGPVDRRLDAGGLPVRVEITPAAVGENRFRVELPGAEATVVERLQLTLSFLEAELGEQPLVLAAGATPGAWEAASPLLSQPGRWQAELLVRRRGRDDARSAFRFTVAGPGGAAAAQPASVSAAYPLLPSPLVSLALASMVLGAVVLGYGAWRVPHASAPARKGMLVLVAAGLLAAGYGGYVYARERESGIPLDVARVRNPLPPDQGSLASGRAIYEEHCAACHGLDGRGDGPLGVTLRPRPADLRVHMAAGHTDGQLFFWVSYGVRGTAMPAWAEALSEEQRWNVINFLRTFAGPSPPPAQAASARP